MKKILLIAITLFCIFGIFSNSEVASIDSIESDVRLPIVMYHSIYKGNNNAFVLSPTQFENDLKFLKDNGFTTILSKDLVAYQKSPMHNLPVKPIIITLDDGCYNNLTDVLPLLKKYNMKAIVSVVGEFTEKSMKENHFSKSYSSLSWGQMKEMQDSGLVEIGNHTFSLHHNNASRQGARKNVGESVGAYQQMLEKDLSKLQNKLKAVGIVPISFAFPYGKYSLEAGTVLQKLGIKCSFTCTEKVNFINRKSNLLWLNRFNRPSGQTSNQFFVSRKIV